MRTSLGTVGIWIGTALLLFSALGALLTFREFHRYKISPHFKPSAVLVTTGPFKYSRNPLYLLASTVLLGLGLVFDNLWLILVLVPVKLAISKSVIKYEEQYLERKFGEEYRCYKECVRRWL